MNFRLATITALFCTGALSGCGGGTDPATPNGGVADVAEMSRDPSARSIEPKSTTSTPVIPAGAATPVPTGRLLASNCFGCHGTNGIPNGGFDRLAGESASEIVSELKEMRSKADKGIMRVHALGYTDQQAWELATFFANQR